jgi:hypothetical protein
MLRIGQLGEETFRMDKRTPDSIWYLFLFLVPGFLMAFWINLFLNLKTVGEPTNTSAEIDFLPGMNAEDSWAHAAGSCVWQAVARALPPF